MVKYLGTISVIWEFDTTGDGAPPQRTSVSRGRCRNGASAVADIEYIDVVRVNFTAGCAQPNRPFKMISRGVTAFQELDGN